MSRGSRLRQAVGEFMADGIDPSEQVELAAALIEAGRRNGRAGMPRQGEMDKAQMVEFGVRLRSLREAAGLSQRQLAIRAGRSVSPAYVSRIESGDRGPSVSVMERLAAGLGVSVEFLRSGEILDSVLGRVTLRQVADELRARGVEPERLDARDLAWLRRAVEGTIEDFGVVEEAVFRFRLAQAESPAAATRMVAERQRDGRSG